MGVLTMNMGVSWVNLEKVKNAKLKTTFVSYFSENCMVQFGHNMAKNIGSKLWTTSQSLKYIWLETSNVLVPGS